MKKIKRIGALLALFMLSFYNTCFADLIWYDENGKRQGGGSGNIKPSASNHILIGILIVAVIVCVAVIISKIINNKKENDNDNVDNN